ncbi:MAG: SRPBCC domain-containing protein [Deltaproteobacteria bacterium]
MKTIQYEIDIEAPIEKVSEYYTDPNNIKEAWPQDIVKESKPTTDSKNEKGSEIEVKGEYMEQEDEMRLKVTEKEQNKRLVTRQTEGPFKVWESIQEFQNGSGSNKTHVKHIINYELPTSGKIANIFTRNQAEGKLKQGIEQAANTVKQKLESQTR